MIDEGQVRQLREVLKGNLDKETNPTRMAAFAGGISALGMVLGEDDD
jgi:hypothetical protein